MADTKTLTAQCFCKAVHYNLTVPTASLPLRVHLCHCSICRYTHGTLCIFHAVLPKGVVPEFIAPSSMAAMTGYTHDASKSERFFCSTCGCHIGDMSIEDECRGEWNVATSVFQDHGPANFRVGAHVYTHSAPDGGLHEMLTRDMFVWNPAPDDPANDAGPPPLPAREVDAEGRERLRAQCHCGGVSFTIPRPSIAAVVDDPYLSKWVSPLDANKWIACLDVCDDCRLVSGAHVVPWTFVPRALLDPPMPRELEGYGTLKRYSSSEGVARGFCGKCGATVVYFAIEREPTEAQAVVDIAVGVLRAPEGVMAEEWLTWRTGRLGWPESGMRYDAAFTKALEEGFAQWGERKYGKSVDFKIGA